MKSVDKKIIYKCASCGYADVKKKFEQKYHERQLNGEDILKEEWHEWHKCPQCKSEAIVDPDAHQLIPIKPQSPK